MIIYNVTVKIDQDVHDDWLQWMQECHIPDVMSTGLFLAHRLCRIFSDDPDGTSYAIQYTCESMENLQLYQQKHAQRLQAEHTARYRDKFVAFRTLLEVVE